MILPFASKSGIPSSHILILSAFLLGVPDGALLNALLAPLLGAFPLGAFALGALTLAAFSDAALLVAAFAVAAFAGAASIAFVF